jgi:hypothetical protein
MFCFPFNLHDVAILLASKFSDFFHQLINRREMTVGRKYIYQLFGDWCFFFLLHQNGTRDILISVARLRTFSFLGGRDVVYLFLVFLLMVGGSMTDILRQSGG